MRILQSYKEVFVGLHRNVWVISAVLFINRMGSMVLLFAPLYYTSILGFSKAEAGFIMSFFGIGSILGSYFGGWLADRFNAKKIMLFALFSSAIILCSINFVSNKYFLCAVLFFYALSADIFRPPSSVAIMANSTAENRTRSISLMRMAINLGFSIGPALGGIIAYKLGYNILFYLDALTSVLAALFLYFLYPNIPANAVHATKPKLAAESSAYKDWHFLKFIFLVAVYGICFFQLIVSVPTYFKQDCHYTEDLIGYLLALNGTLVVLIEMPLVAYLQKANKLKWYIVIGCLQIMVALACLILGKGLLAMSVLFIFFITLSEVLAMPFMMNYTLERAPKERQGQYAALYSIAYGVAFIVAPALGLALAQRFGFVQSFGGFILLTALLAFSFYKLLR